YAQEANVMNLTHKSYDPYELTRTDHDAWTITVSDFVPDIVPPASLAVTASTGSGSTLYEYAVTSESDETGDISFLQDLVATSQTITGISQANPAEVTTSGSHGYSTGYRVYITGVVGMTEVNDAYYTITSTGATTFTLDGVDSTGFTIYGSAGSARET